jgi:hypothetical protein
VLDRGSRVDSQGFCRLAVISSQWATSSIRCVESRPPRRVPSSHGALVTSHRCSLEFSPEGRNWDERPRWFRNHSVSWSWVLGSNETKCALLSGTGARNTCCAHLQPSTPLGDPHDRADGRLPASSRRELTCASPGATIPSSQFVS